MGPQQSSKSISVDISDQLETLYEEVIDAVLKVQPDAELKGVFPIDTKKVFKAFKKLEEQKDDIFEVYEAIVKAIQLQRKDVKLKTEKFSLLPSEEKKKRNLADMVYDDFQSHFAHIYLPGAMLYSFKKE